VAKDHGPPGTEEVDIAVVVGVEEVRSKGAGDKGRMSADCAKGTDGRVDSTGKKLFGALLQGFRSGVIHLD
jgi:hypothetical protein